MNKQQAEWLNEYLRTGDDIRAVEVAYPDVAKKNRSAKVGALKAALGSEIDKQSREQYIKEAPKMLNVIKMIALECEQPAVKLKAADTWLSRAGHDAAQVLEIKDTATHEQLIERLKIAMTGLPQELINQVIPKELVNQISDKPEETKRLDS